MEISIRTIKANELPQNGTRNVPKGLHPGDPAIFEHVDANIELRDGMNEGRREGGNGPIAAREGPDSSNRHIDEAHISNERRACSSSVPKWWSGKTCNWRVTGGGDGGSVHMLA
ncbi:hypothetical protein LTR96_000437, partial [Exophiala xenobiotica]